MACLAVAPLAMLVVPGFGEFAECVAYAGHQVEAGAGERDPVRPVEGAAREVDREGEGKVLGDRLPRGVGLFASLVCHCSRALTLPLPVEADVMPHLGVYTVCPAAACGSRASAVAVGCLGCRSVPV